MARTVIVGDVHGCVDELRRLVDELGLVPEDRVYFVGDLVTRGPDSRGVLALYRQLGASAVLGNHELRLLQARRAELSGRRRLRLSPPQYAVLRQLDEGDWALLAALPTRLDLPEHDVCIVHAGLAPDLALEQQDEWTLTHTRSIDAEGKPSTRHDLALWASRYQRGPHVVFGHNSRAGLQLAPRATGLDTGCVYGGALSALVLEAGQPVPQDIERRRAHVRSVVAARRYYAGTSSSS